MSPVQVLVTGLPSNYYDELVKMFFENSRSASPQHVEMVGQDEAVVTFRSSQGKWMACVVTGHLHKK